LNEYIKMRGVNKTITTYPGTSDWRGNGRTKMADAVSKQSFEPFHKYHHASRTSIFGAALLGNNTLQSAWYVATEAELVTFTSLRPWPEQLPVTSCIVHYLNRRVNKAEIDLNTPSPVEAY
jgi:hypothetical protein